MTELAERWTALCYLERKLIILNMQSEESERERERERERGGVAICDLQVDSRLFLCQQTKPWHDRI